VERFAQGKPNALVVDIGATTTSVTPIWDGFVLKKGESARHVGLLVVASDCCP